MTKHQGERPLDEPVLADDYPVYADNLYVADGKVIRSDWHDVTVAHLKRALGASEIRRCDIYGRQATRQATGADQNRGESCDANKEEGR